MIKGYSIFICCLPTVPSTFDPTPYPLNDFFFDFGPPYIPPQWFLPKKIIEGGVWTPTYPLNDLLFQIKMTPYIIFKDEETIPPPFFQTSTDSISDLRFVMLFLNPQTSNIILTAFTVA